MSIQKIQSCFKTLQYWVENYGTTYRDQIEKDLFKSIVDYLTNPENKDSSKVVPLNRSENKTFVIPSILEMYITLDEFVDKYRIFVRGKKEKLISTETLSSMLNHNPLLREALAIRESKHPHKWRIQPLSFIWHLSNSDDYPRTRNKCRIWIDQNPERMKHLSTCYPKNY